MTVVEECAKAIEELNRLQYECARLRKKFVDLRNESKEEVQQERMETMMKEKKS